MRGELGLSPRGPLKLGLTKSSLAWPGSSVRSFAAGNGSAFATTFPFGLTNPGATDKFYTTRLDMEVPLLLRDTRADFWQAALSDAADRGLGVEAYLAAALLARSAFVRSSVLHKRVDDKLALLNLFKETGQFGLFLGGKNVGKSLLLEDLSRTSFSGLDGMLRAVVKIDARTCGTNLTEGLLAAIRNEEREQNRAGIWSGQRRTQDACEPTRESFLSVLRANWPTLAVTPAPNIALLAKVLEIADENNMYLCLIVDESNLAFPTPPGSTTAPLSEEKQRELVQTQALLNRLVELTKQSQRINVLLAVSEYGYPYRLQTDNFFNTANVTDVIYASEVPPADMRNLLQEKWKLGPRLADVFLAYYGGHVHTASQALAMLATALGQFDCEWAVPLPGSIPICLNQSSDQARTALMLRDLAERGFAPVTYEEDSVAQLLAQHNVGGLVRSNARGVSVPPDVRTAGGAAFSILPSSNFIRHMISKELYHKAKADAAAAEKLWTRARAVV